jgi:hypothetical protein
MNTYRYEMIYFICRIIILEDDLVLFLMIMQWLENCTQDEEVALQLGTLTKIQ